MYRVFFAALVAATSTKAQNRCGVSWVDANGNCDATRCVYEDAPCPAGEHCYADLAPCDNEPQPQPAPACNRPQPPAPGPAPPVPVPAPPSPTIAPSSSPPSGACAMSTYMGYYASWATTRACNSMLPEEIDPTPYTHLVFSFAKVSPAYELEPYFDTDLPLYPPFNALKQRKEGLKTLIAIGGWTHNDPGTPTRTLFSEAAATDERRKTFAASCVQFLQEHDFDGIDIDWEFPGDPSRGGNAQDKANLPLLLQEIKAQLDAAPKPYILSIAVPLSSFRLNLGYALNEIQPHVDHINIMSYDLHGTWDLSSAPYVNAHANLTEIDAALDLFNGVNSEKLNLGLGAYGRTAKLASDACAEPGCEFVAAGQAGECTQEPGVLAYSEIIDLQVSPTIQPNEAAYGTYTSESGGTSWVGYDTPETLQQKVNRAKARCFGGVMAWSIDQDSKTSPLLSTVNLS